MSCSLCHLPLPKDPLTEDSHAFCCAGCRTVFAILKTQENIEAHPLYQEALASGVIAAPFPSEKETPLGPTQKLHFEIHEMWCTSCADAISFILCRHRGIKSCLVDYATDLAIIEYDPMQISKDKIFRKIGSLGYHPAPLLERKGDNGWTRFAVSAFCALNIMMFSLPLYAKVGEGFAGPLGWLCFFLALPLVTYSTFPIWRRFLTSLRTGLLGMETLVLIGACSAFGVSTISLLRGAAIHLYFDSMSMLIVLVLLGKILERKAKFSAKETLFRLTRSLPRRGRRRLSDGSIETVLIKEITKGDVLTCTSGEKVVLDGRVIRGEGVCNEAVMTGEPRPVRKRVGDPVIGGSVVTQGHFDFAVEASEKETLLSQILEAIESRLGNRGQERPLIERFLPYFVPCVILLALATGFLSKDPLRALSVLLISCPCAIGIAAPLAEAFTIRALAEKGCLVRNRRALSLLAKDPLFVFDKTGTLTEGVFSPLSGLETLSSPQKQILKGLAQSSTHPVASALAAAIGEPPTPLVHVEEIIGQGIVGVLDGRSYLLGSQKLVKNAPEHHGMETVVYFGEETHCLAKILLGDRLRKVSLPKNALLLSGDHEKAVEAVAKGLGIQHWKSGISPLGKQKEIEELKRGGIVAMVGDGVNDAAALAAADIGISVSSGSDMAISVSDLLITERDFSALVPLAKRGQKIIAQNLFWAFIYNGVGIGFAMKGALHPLLAASAMVLSSTAVVLNALRRF